ncbi:MAG: DNA alkylation repair protein [Ferruginibacter sp.]|nr:DNA alkylation repair protein [Cytophagales bacterium]
MVGLEGFGRLAGLARPKPEYNGGISVRYSAETAYGVGITVLRRYARGVKKNHALAEELWRTGVREARTLATLADEPGEVTETQMEA